MGGKDKSEMRRDLVRRAASVDDPQGHSALATALGLQPSSVNSALTNGIRSRHLQKLEVFLASHQIPFDRDLWSLKRAPAGGQVTTFANLDLALADLLGGEVSNFLCIRSPSQKPRRPGVEIDVDEGRIVDFSTLPEDYAPAPYLANVWDRVQSDTLSGKVFWGLGRIGSIPEIWASLEIIKKNQIQGVEMHLLDQKYFIDGESYYPIMGTRVVDNRRCLLSAPSDDPNDRSQRSIVNDGNLAGILDEYAEELVDLSDDLTGMLLGSAEGLLEREYDRLVKEEDDAACHYGELNDFSKVELAKDRIVAEFTPGAKRWLPPLA
jgi:hypothetical protein